MRPKIPAGDSRWLALVDAFRAIAGPDDEIDAIDAPEFSITIRHRSGFRQLHEIQADELTMPPTELARIAYASYRARMNAIDGFSEQAERYPFRPTS